MAEYNQGHTPRSDGKAKKHDVVRYLLQLLTNKFLQATTFEWVDNGEILVVTDSGEHLSFPPAGTELHLGTNTDWYILQAWTGLWRSPLVLQTLTCHSSYVQG
jgi:hypothetical protein